MLRIFLQPGKASLGGSLLILGLLGLGCAFTSQIVDRTVFDKKEMYFDDTLPDRDLPDITGMIVSGGGGGAGGGAVGGCWSCG